MGPTLFDRVDHADAGRDRHRAQGDDGRARRDRGGEGATLIIVNADPTPHDSRAEYVFRANLVVIPELVDNLPTAP